MPTVSIKDQNLKFEVKEGAILFDSLDDQGHELPHGCLAGSCGACRTLIVEGAENLAPPSMIEENTIQSIMVNYKRIHGDSWGEGKTIRLACRARVNGDVTIEELNS